MDRGWGSGCPRGTPHAALPRGWPGARKAQSQVNKRRNGEETAIRNTYTVQPQYVNQVKVTARFSNKREQNCIVGNRQPTSSPTENKQTYPISSLRPTMSYTNHSQSSNVMVGSHQKVWHNSQNLYTGQKSTTTNEYHNAAVTHWFNRCLQHYAMFVRIGLAFFSARRPLNVHSGSRAVPRAEKVGSQHESGNQKVACLGLGWGWVVWGKGSSQVWVIVGIIWEVGRRA